MKLLLKHRSVEGVKASIDLFKIGGRWTKVVMMKEWAKLGRSVTAIDAGKEIPDLLRNYRDKNFMDEAKKALDSIADESKPIVAFKRFK